MADEKDAAPGPPLTVVVVGCTSALAKAETFPALHGLLHDGLVSSGLSIIGVGTEEREGAAAPSGIDFGNHLIQPRTYE